MTKKLSEPETEKFLLQRSLSTDHNKLQVSDSLIGNDKPNKSPSIKNNILVKD